MGLKSDLLRYKRSKRTAYDEDLLLKALSKVGINTVLTVTASDMDSSYELVVCKRETGWLIDMHWMYPHGSVIPDNYIKHDLSWLLAVPNSQISVLEP